MNSRVSAGGPASLRLLSIRRVPDINASGPARNALHCLRRWRSNGMRPGTGFRSLATRHAWPRRRSGGAERWKRVSGAVDRLSAHGVSSALLFLQPEGSERSGSPRRGRRGCAACALAASALMHICTQLIPGTRAAPRQGQAGRDLENCRAAARCRLFQLCAPSAGRRSRSRSVGRSKSRSKSKEPGNQIAAAESAVPAWQAAHCHEQPPAPPIAVVVRPFLSSRLQSLSPLAESAPPPPAAEILMPWRDRLEVLISEGKVLREDITPDIMSDLAALKARATLSAPPAPRPVAARSRHSRPISPLGAALSASAPRIPLRCGCPLKCALRCPPSPPSSLASVRSRLRLTRSSSASARRT